MNYRIDVCLYWDIEILVERSRMSEGDKGKNVLRWCIFSRLRVKKLKEIISRGRGWKILG